ncbi:MAG: TetR/AcrR family transcriptional regulator [Solirubrobacteraceae bacterium]
MSGSKRARPGANGDGKPKRAKAAIVPIYARLPKGPHSIGATGVARNQRIRMHGGMIEAVATRGYEHTSVRLVIGLAGVSRRAFYEQFSGKEECFIATFDLVVKRAIQRLTHAYRTAEGDPEKRLRMALEALGEEIEQNPKALHLVMIDAQTAGPEGLRRLHKTTALCEGLLRSVFSEECWPTTGFADGPIDDRPADRPEALPLPVVRAIVGGLRRTTSMRLRDGETEDLGALPREMLKWSLLFKSPAAAQLRPRPCASPPVPEVATLEPDACGGESSRGRLLRSAIELLVREEKLDELSSLRIADAALLPIEAFMELFSGPEACYLEALDVLGDELLQLVADPGLVSAEWPAAVCHTVDALLEYLARSPARLQTLAVKAFEAGPAAIASVGDLAYEVATLLSEGAPRRPRTRIAVEGIAGALWQILNCEATAGRGHRLPVLCEYVSYVVLAPFIGPEAAVQAVVRSRRPAASVQPEEASAAAAQTNGNHARNGASPTPSTRIRTPPTAHTANGSNGSPVSPREDYRRLAERRSTKCVNTIPTSTESTITTIKGA